MPDTDWGSRDAPGRRTVGAGCSCDIHRWKSRGTDCCTRLEGPSRCPRQARRPATRRGWCRRDPRGSTARTTTCGQMSIVYLIGAGPGHPELIAVRGVQCLRAADVVLYDNQVHPRLLRYARRDAEKIAVGVTT